jgi:long-chain acyl-CoA synthetase
VIIDAISTHARLTPDRLAILGDQESLTYGQLWNRIEVLATWLTDKQVKRLGINLENGPDWVIADLAALAAGILTVPIPPFFSASQAAYISSQAGIDCTVQAAKPPGENATTKDEKHGINSALPGLSSGVATRSGNSLRQNALDGKITFTSGSTGEPKGVTLSAEDLSTITASIVRAMADVDVSRHLVVLPLATLLENVAGVYAPLVKGIEVVIPAPASVGLQGSSGLDIASFATCLSTYEPQSVILVPQLLMALTTLSEMAMIDPTFLRFVAVGGGKVSRELLSRADAQLIPAFEGYGLSEAGSVVALNLPGHHREGSVGKVLPHARVRINEDREIEVAGTLMSGYLGDHNSKPHQWLRTGDLGHLDDDGYLYIDGRRKNMFITAFGRNINPEWVEAELSQHAVIGQVLFYGEQRDHNLALIWPRFSGAEQAVDEAIEQTNAGLPDYAKVNAYLVFDTPLSPDYITSNGRLKRQAVIQTFSPQIETHYVAKIPVAPPHADQPRIKTQNQGY